MSPGKKRESLSFAVLVCLMASFFGLPGVWYSLKLAIPQGFTLGYAESQGTILFSQIEESKSSRSKDTSPSYVFNVRYAHEVDGRVYTSSRVFHGVMPGELDMARALSRRFPLNARVPVYYPADNPSQSVLLRAPEGLHLSQLLVCFSLLAGVWWSGYALVWEVRRRSRGFQTVVMNGRTHVRWGLGLGGWFVLMILSVTASYLLPSELSLSLTWGRLVLFFAVLMVASTFVESRRRALIVSGEFDVVLDEQRGVLSLPPMNRVGRRTRFELPLRHIQRFQIEEHPGGRGGRVSDWVLVLMMRDEVTSLRVPVVSWRFEDKIEALWHWLKQRPELKHVLFTPR